MGALDDIDAVGGDDRQHGILDPRAGGRVVLLALGPERKLAIGEHVARLGEGRHPAAVLDPRVPAHVIGVQVRAHDEVDVPDADAGRREALLEPVRLHHVPERAGRARLVVADAAVDQDVVMRRLHQVALDAQIDPVGGVEIDGLEPSLVFLVELLTALCL